MRKEIVTAQIVTNRCNEILRKQMSGYFGDSDEVLHISVPQISNNIKIYNLKVSLCKTHTL